LNLLLPVATVFPIFFYMVAGAFLKRIKRLSDGTVTQMNKIIFSYLFPFVMFNNIYKTQLSQVLNVLLIPRLFAGKPVQGSIIQALIRGNTILFALPVVSAIAGPENTGLASLCIAIVVPMYNIICTVILEALRGRGLQPLPLLTSLIKNPLILGALFGLGAKLIDLHLPLVLMDVVSDIARLVTPLALIMLGAALRFSDNVTYRRELVWVSVAKLIIIPFIYVAVIKLMGFDKVAVATALALGAVPTAVSTYVMAQQMDADGALAGQLVAVTSVLSIVTVFLWVLLLSSIGWIA
jgi:predicted permease